MKNIELVKPVVLMKDLGDMTPDEKKKALRMLCMKEKFDGLYGSEAVCAFRRSLELRDVAIRTIRVNAILEAVPDIFTLEDIVYLMKRMVNRNNRMKRLVELDCPERILECEYHILWMAVENLNDNNWNGHPIIAYVNDDEEEIPYKSLADVDIEL